VSRGEIVGVVADVKQNDLKEKDYPAVYLPHGTFPQSLMAFIVRSSADPATLSASIRRRVADIDPELPIYDMETMSQAVSASVAQPRFYTLLLAAFAGLALLLAALGIYGVISYTVSQRTRELGIRIALGATNERIMRLVLGQGLALMAAGVAIGVLGALALMRVLSTMLFSVRTTDAATFIVVPVVLAVVAAIASYLPARRAARVDPVIAMRAE
jgi:putative ABC transport system permease protein